MPMRIETPLWNRIAEAESAVLDAGAESGTSVEQRPMLESGIDTDARSDADAEPDADADSDLDANAK